MPNDPPVRPISIHGRRMPNRDVVRSLSRPNSGLPTIATSEPDAGDERQAVRQPGRRPTSELTFKARVTSSGAMKTRLVAR